VRHPLPVIGNDNTEKVLKAAINTEHAVVLDRIREEASQDTVMWKLSQTIRKGNWESSKRDADLIPFYQVKDELYESQGMIFRMEKIILPANLQQKFIKSADSLGQLGMTKMNMDMWICKAWQCKTLLYHPVVPQDLVDQKERGDDLRTWMTLLRELPGDMRNTLTHYCIE